jgi:septal ring factor EnvC (AmiA/AmiB activator)
MPRPLALLIILITLLLPGVAPAKSGMSAILENNLAEQQKRIKQVQKAMDEKRNRLRDSRAREVNLMGQLEEIDKALGSGRGRLSKLTKEAAAKREEIRRRNEELTALNTAHENAREHVKNRLAAFYRMGEVGMLNVVFASATLPDLLNVDESFRILLAQDQKTIATYHQQIADLTRLRDELERENSQLRGVIADSEQQTRTLADSRNQRLRLLASISKEKKLYQQALAEMEEAADNLNKTMALLRERLAAGQGVQPQKGGGTDKKTAGQAGGFAAMKGRLPPPARGTVTTYFGKSNQGKFGIASRADGIDIKTVSGTEISAIHKGKVVYVGQLRGYGNLMIIDHGQQYYSLVSRAAEFYKREGEMVAAGEVVGVMNDQGGLLGEGLHFEIRHGTDAQDPLEWVNRSLLRTAPAPPSPGKDRKNYKNN